MVPLGKVMLFASEKLKTRSNRREYTSGLEQ